MIKHFIACSLLLIQTSVLCAFEEEINTLLANPGHDEAFYSLSAPNPKIDEALSQRSEEEQAQLSTLITFRELYAAHSRQAQAPDKQFVLRMRDFIMQHKTFSERMQGLEQWLNSPEELTLTELDMIRRAVMVWCGNYGRRLVDARYAHHFLTEFRDGRPVILTQRTEHDIAEHMGHCLSSFIQTERTLNDRIPSSLSNGRYRLRNLLAALIWKDETAALALARGKGLSGYELLQQKPENIPNWLMSRGIIHYSKYGFDIPDSCLTALNPQHFISQNAALEQLQEQNTALPQPLQALVPRCMLALGNSSAPVWEPVIPNNRGCHPHWPDASAPTLPQWSPTLLGLNEESKESIEQAFTEELAKLEQLIIPVREYHSTSAILTAALEECARVRPINNSNHLPIYLSIALDFSRDGITIDYDMDEEELLFSTREEIPVIVQQAQLYIPQHIHRLTLMLAVLEQQGHIAEIRQNCSALARLLNRHNLWPLIICQRELRGFSPLALISLFTHYEGNAELLMQYGKAMGMPHEMQIAALGHEDNLSINLFNAAIISGVFMLNEDEHCQATSELLELARQHAYDADPTLTGSIITHLLRHGVTEPILSWQDCPTRFFCGRYSMNGLRLIQALKDNNQIEAAQKLLAIMQNEAHYPATRLAAAVLADNPEQKKSCIRDALLLSMLWYIADEQIYRECRDYLIESGIAPLEAIRMELICTDGRSAGITPAMADMYHRAGDIQKERFVWEYLLATGISVATPYGDCPTQADIAHYRQQADACRKNATSSENEAIPPRTTEQAQYDTAVLPAREWKRKNGLPSVTGQLVALYEQQAAIRILKQNGKTDLLLLSELAENPTQHIEKWKQTCGFELWEWSNPPWHLANFSRIWGKPVAAAPDFTCPGKFMLSVRKPDGDIAQLRCMGLKGKQAQRAAEFCNSYMMKDGLKIAASPAEAAAMAGKDKLPVIVVCCPYGETQGMPGYHTTPANKLLSYLAANPQATQAWSNCIILPAPFKQLSNGQFGYPDKEKQALLQLESQLCPPGVAGEITPLAQALQAAISHSRSDFPIICWLSTERHESGVLDINPISSEPAEALLHLTPLTTPPTADSR